MSFEPINHLWRDRSSNDPQGRGDQRCIALGQGAVRKRQRVLEPGARVISALRCQPDNSQADAPRPCRRRGQLKRPRAASMRTRFTPASPGSSAGSISTRKQASARPLSSRISAACASPNACLDFNPSFEEKSDNPQSAVFMDVDGGEAGQNVPRSDERDVVAYVGNNPCPGADPDRCARAGRADGY